MKILFFSYAYPNARQPGLGTFNRTMVAGLTGAHEVRVVAPVPFPDVWRERLSKLTGVSVAGAGGWKDSTYTAVPGVEASHPTFYYPPKVLRSQYGHFLDWSVGRLVPIKGFQHLIASCAVLKTRGRTFDCHILGDGPLRGPLQRQIEHLGLEDCVKLAGPQSQTRLAEWYRAADLTVLSSLSEGVPNVLLESLACGTPFVATSVGGVPEIADRLYDRLVPPASPVAMADAIEGRLSSPLEVQQRRCFEPFDLRASARKLERVLEGALFDHAAAHHVEQVQSKSASPARAVPQSTSQPTNKFDWDWRNTPPGLNTSVSPSTASMAISLNEPSAELAGTTTAAFSRPSNGQFEGELGRTGEYFTLSAK